MATIIFQTNLSRVLSKPFTVFVNQSLHIGILVYSSQLKLSPVKQLFQNGNKTHFNNYSLISLLPALSKIFGYVIFDQLLHYYYEKLPVKFGTIWMSSRAFHGTGWS